MRLALFLIFTFNYISGFGQSLTETYGFAESLYKAGSNENAIEAYKRVLFFDSASLYTADIYPKIAQCLYNEKRFKEASTYFELAYNSSKETVIKNELLLKNAGCLLLIKDYDFAKIELLNLNDSLNNTQLKESILLNAMIDFAKSNFKESELGFKTITPDTNVVNSLFRKNDKISKISPRKARIMSMFLPGLGQFYVGDIKNGINSLILTGGLFALGVRSTIINGPLDAIISTIPWFQRYYQGGFNKAEIIAIAKIEEKRYKVFNALLDEVEKGK